MSIFARYFLCSYVSSSASRICGASGTFFMEDQTFMIASVFNLVLFEHRSVAVLLDVYP